MEISDHFLGWVLIFSFLSWFTVYLLEKIGIFDRYLFFIAAGIIITIGSWIIYSLLYRNGFVITKWFFVWIITHAFLFWIIQLILSLIEITDTFLYFLLFGIILNTFTYILKYKVFA